jgi:hypothetical protein
MAARKQRETRRDEEQDVPLKDRHPEDYFLV